jgi:hypothetical protein
MERKKTARIAACLIASMFVASCSRTNSDGLGEYVPSIRTRDGSYRFSEAQLQRMEKTPLDRTVFLQYLEAQWPVDKLKAFCTPEHRYDERYQNLVPDRMCFNDNRYPVHDPKKLWGVNDYLLSLHDGRQLEFDTIHVYVVENRTGTNYDSSLAKTWRRWTYSLNLYRDEDHWVIIDSLPNDLMDNQTKYLTQQQGQHN